MTPSLSKVLNFKTAVAGIIFVKLLVLAAGSYPFDFATYVYQARSFFQFNINPLFYWDKGVPLLGLFYAQYSIYQAIVQQFFGGAEQTALLHFIFKLPFFVLDLLSAYVIRDIVIRLNRTTRTANFAALLWLANPLMLWFNEFQGQYAVVATFFALLSVSLILRKRFFASAIMVGISTVVYYYAAIFMPFYLLKYISKRGFRPGELIKIIGCFFGTVFLSYLPFLLNKNLFTDLLGSLLHHSAPDAATAHQAVLLPDYTLLKAPYYLVTGTSPTNLTAPALFEVAQIFTFVGLLLVLGYAAVRGYNILRRHQQYSDLSLLADLLAVITLFLIFIGKFQDHYLVWIFPFMIIYGVASPAKNIWQNTFIISAVVPLLIFSAANIGIYLLDILPFGVVNIFIAQDPYTRSVGGFAVIFLLIANVFFAVKQPAKITLSIPSTATYIYAGVSFLFVSILAIYSYVGMASLNIDQQLGSDANVYNFTYAYNQLTSKNDANKSDPVAFADSDFALEKPSVVIESNSYLNPPASPWFLYNYGGSSNFDVSIAPGAGINRGQALSFDLLKGATDVQLNMGGNNSQNLIPITPTDRYEASFYVSSGKLPTSYLTTAIRFADNNKTIIPASDRFLPPSSSAGGWQKYELTFNPSAKAGYMEFEFTINVPKGLPGERILVDDFELHDIQQRQTLTLVNVHPKDHAQSLRKYIIDAPAAKFFKYVVTIDRFDRTNKDEMVSLGKCQTPASVEITQDTEYAYFPPTCLEEPNPALVTNLVNYDRQPTVTVSLTHTPSVIHDSNAHSVLLKFIAFLAGVIEIVIIAATAVLVTRWIRGSE